METAMTTVLFAFYSQEDYLQTLSQVNDTLPYLYALDYLHLFYIKQILYKAYLSVYASHDTALIKSIVINIQLDVIFHILPINGVIVL